MTTLFALALLAASVEVTVDYVTATETNRTVIFMRAEGTNRITIAEGRVANIEPAKPPMMPGDTDINGLKLDTNAVKSSTRQILGPRVPAKPPMVPVADGQLTRNTLQLPSTNSAPAGSSLVVGPPVPAMLAAPPSPPVSWRVSKRLPGSVHIGTPLPLTNEVPMMKFYQSDYRQRQP